MKVDPAPPELDEDYEVKAAIRLLDGPPIDLALLHQLVGQPRRYGELRDALKPKADMELNRSLRRLLDLAIIDRTTDHSQKPPLRTYRLNPIGIHVFYTIGHIRTAHQAESITRAILENRDVKASA